MVNAPKRKPTQGHGVSLTCRQVALFQLTSHAIETVGLVLHEVGASVVHLILPRIKKAYERLGESGAALKWIEMANIVDDHSKFLTMTNIIDQMIANVVNPIINLPCGNDVYQNIPEPIHGDLGDDSRHCLPHYFFLAAVSPQNDC